MDDEPTTDRVQLTKGDPAAAKPAGRTRGLPGKSRLAADGTPMPPPPPSVRYAVIALGVTAVGALTAAAALFGQKAWLLRTYVDNNPDPGKKNHQSMADLRSTADKAPSTSLLVSAVLVVALAFAASGAWRGRYWARWTVIGLWVLATFTSTFAGFTYLVAIASNEPLPFKIPSFIAAAALIVAVVFVSIRPSAEYFKLSKPPRPDAGGAAPRRGGLFGPRPARQGFGKPAATRTPATRTPASSSAGAGTERSRAKQRASTESVAKGAELARARAKASKSRRSGV